MLQSAFKSPVKISGSQRKRHRIPKKQQNRGNRKPNWLQ